MINAYLNAGLIYGKQGLVNVLGLEKTSFDFSNLWFWADFDGMGVSGGNWNTYIFNLDDLHYFYY